jgi:hypothetical protein
VRSRFPAATARFRAAAIPCCPATFLRANVADAVTVST